MASVILAPTIPISSNLRKVSATNLKILHPPRNLIDSFWPTNPDRKIWGDAYKEEHFGLKDKTVFLKITESEYQDLLQKYGDAARAIPSMNIFTIKHDEIGKPVRAKSRCVVLGNLERRLWTKEDKYAQKIRRI